MKVTTTHIGPYEVYKDKGNETFIALMESIWNPDNPKNINRYSMAWVKVNYICHQLFFYGSDDTKKCSRALSLCKALVYGWDRPVSDGLLLSPYYASVYLGITPNDDEPTGYFQELEQTFDSSLWTEIKQFLIGLSETGEVEDLEK